MNNNNDLYIVYTSFSVVLHILQLFLIYFMNESQKDTSYQ